MAIKKEKKEEEKKGILERFIPVTKKELKVIERKLDLIEKLIEQRKKKKIAAKKAKTKITALKCKGTGKDGKPCKGIALKGSDYCKWHQPKVTKESETKE